MKKAPEYLKYALVVCAGVTAFFVGARVARAGIACKTPEGVMGHPACLGWANSECPFCTPVGGDPITPTCSPTTKRWCEGWCAWRTVYCDGCETEVQDVPCYREYSCNPPSPCAGYPCFVAGPAQYSQTTFQDERCVGVNCQPCP